MQGVIDRRRRPRARGRSRAVWAIPRTIHPRPHFLSRARTPHGFPLSYSPLDLASPGCLDGAGASSLPVRRSDRGGRGFGGAVSRRSRPARPSIPTGERVRERGSGREGPARPSIPTAVHSDGREGSFLASARHTTHPAGCPPISMPKETPGRAGASAMLAGGALARMRAAGRRFDSVSGWPDGGSLPWAAKGDSEALPPSATLV